MLHNWANCYTSVEKNARLISFTVGFALRRSKLVQETYATLSADKVEKRKKNHRDSVARVFLHSKHCACRSFSSVLSASWAVYFCCDCSYRIYSFNSICTNLIKKRSCAKKVLTILTLTAMPLRSEEAEAAVWVVLGTVFVLVSLIMILDAGIPKHLAATCKNITKEGWNLSLCRHVLYNLTPLIISVTWRYKQEQLTRLTNISPAPFWCVVLGPFLFRHELKELIRLCKHATELQPE